MEPKTIYTQLLAFQNKVNVIKKDSTNPHFKNTYASLAQIIGEVKPTLSECLLVLTQPIDDKGIHTVISYNNESVIASIPMPTGLTPQQLGSAITYFRRYTLAALLALEIDDDDAQATNTPPKVLSKPTANEIKPQAENIIPPQPKLKDEEVKPWLTEAQFKKAMARIEQGDLTVYHKTIEAFKMKKDYRTSLDEIAKFTQSLTT